MALTAFQREILSHLARNRSPNSFFGGGATLNRHRDRRSRDFDIEHVAADAVESAFQADREALARAGYQVDEVTRNRRTPGFAQAIVSGQAGTTLIDWTYDTAVRFFPVIEDAEFGWRLHDADLAVNKVLAMVGRREPRDYYDVVQLHRAGLPLAALAWAGCGKDPGLTPELALDEIVRNSRYQPEELALSVDTDAAIDPVALKADLLRAVAEARDLFSKLPLEQAGRLYLTRPGEVVRPDPAGVEAGRLHLHAPAIGGAWPTLAR